MIKNRVTVNNYHVYHVGNIFSPFFTLLQPMEGLKIHNTLLPSFDKFFCSLAAFQLGEILNCENWNSVNCRRRLQGKIHFENRLD